MVSGSIQSELYVIHTEATGAGAVGGPEKKENCSHVAQETKNPKDRTVDDTFMAPSVSKTDLLQLGGNSLQTGSSPSSRTWRCKQEEIGGAGGRGSSAPALQDLPTVSYADVEECAEALLDCAPLRSG